MEIFKNIGFSCTCGRTKTEVLVPVYDSWIIYILLYPNYSIDDFHCSLRFVLTGENDSNTLRVDAYFFATKTEEKKYPFLEIFGYMWTGPQCNVTF